MALGVYATAHAVQYTGTGSIGSFRSGGNRITVNGVPGAANVYVYDSEAKNVVVASTRSDANGEWRIDNLKVGLKVFVAARSDSGNWDANGFYTVAEFA